jgi:hypothetical protein
MLQFCSSYFIKKAKNFFSANNEDGFQVFSEPKWKLEIILQYFWKYIAKVSCQITAYSI